MRQKFVYPFLKGKKNTAKLKGGFTFPHPQSLQDYKSALRLFFASNEMPMPVGLIREAVARVEEEIKRGGGKPPLYAQKFPPDSSTTPQDNQPLDTPRFIDGLSKFKNHRTHHISSLLTPPHQPYSLTRQGGRGVKRVSSERGVSVEDGECPKQQEG